MKKKELNNQVSIVICVYNNASTLRNVVERCLGTTLCSMLLVVDDGSTEHNTEELLKTLPLTLLTHKTNRGKGAALQTALQYLACNHPQIKWMLTLDADGQHFPEDITKFFDAIENTEEENTLFIGTRNFTSGRGEIPTKSVLGRFLSNFCIKAETGKKIMDTQSGFRCYPVEHIKNLPCKSPRYAWETEILVRALWQNTRIIHIPVQVEYFTKETRISHFKVWKDNLQIAALHCRLLLEAFLKRKKWQEK